MSAPLKVLITGANGQLGKALQLAKPDNVLTFGFGRNELDIADGSAVRSTIEMLKPDIVINAAAYTAVDKAESEPDQALLINSTGVRNLALALQPIEHARLIHVSTDFVFDGKSSSPYSTDAVANPSSVYGSTKYQGECIAMELLGNRALIMRTAWLYAGVGKNFLLTMLRLMRERGEVRVVSDQVGTPTSANSLAKVLWQCVLRSGLSGIYHGTDAGVASWYDFAVAIAEEAVSLGLLNDMVSVIPIATADYPTPAVRPAYSVLDKSRTYDRLDLLPVHWRQELRQVLGELVDA